LSPSPLTFCHYTTLQDKRRHGQDAMCNDNAKEKEQNGLKTKGRGWKGQQQGIQGALLF